MTLCVAWIRTVGDSQELVLASDSRLSGCGETWDACPKVLCLPRSDAAIAFSGFTTRSYPLMLQLVSSIASFPESRRRILDFDEMKGHAVRVFNFILSKVVHEVYDGKEDFIHELAASSFLLCGYSWRQRKFRIIRLSYDESSGAFSSHDFNIRKRTCVFIGDINPTGTLNIPREADERLEELLRSRNKLPHGTLDWEPFEVLRDIIIEANHRTIGGPPQLLKIYPHMNAQMFAVYWPSRSQGTLTIGGRDTLDYERTDWPRLDATNLEVTGISLDDSHYMF